MKINVTFRTKFNNLYFKFEPNNLQNFIKNDLYKSHDLNNSIEGYWTKPDYYVTAELGGNMIDIINNNAVRIYRGPKDKFGSSQFTASDISQKLRIVYNSGTSPGRKRAIKLLEIHPNHIHAIELDSGDPKNYSLDFIGAVEKID